MSNQADPSRGRRPTGRHATEDNLANAEPSQASLQAVAAEAARDAGLADAELLGDFLATVLAVAAARRRLNDSELRACTQAGARAAAAGTAARAAVDLYLSAAWRLWRDGPPAVDPSDPREAALWVLRAADDGVAALIEGFQLARADLVRLEEATRHQVVDALLAGGRQALEASATAEELGLPIAGPLVVVLASSSPRIDGPATARLPAAVETALRGRLADASPLVVFRDSRLLTIAAAPNRRAGIDVADAIADVLRDALGPYGSAGTDWLVAVSNLRVGPVAVRASRAEAEESLYLARRAGIAGPVVTADELGVYRVLLRDRDAARQFVEATLSGLLEARGGPHDLLATLEAFYTCGGNATATASRLHLSVRAVTYRLHRAAELIGRDPHDAEARLTLHAAVTAAQLLGWPDDAEPLP